MLAARVQVGRNAEIWACGIAAEVGLKASFVLRATYPWSLEKVNSFSACSGKQRFPNISRLLPPTGTPHVRDQTVSRQTRWMSVPVIRKALVITSAVAICIGALIIWMPTRPFNPTGRSYTDDMSPVELYVQNSRGEGTRLRIPAAYMQWELDRRGGVVSIIAMVAVYPEMTSFGTLSKAEKMQFIDGDLPKDGPLRFDPLIHVNDGIPDGFERIFNDNIDPKRLRSKSVDSNFARYSSTFAGAARDYLVPHGANMSATGEAVKGPFIECLPLPAGVKEEESRINCKGTILLNDRLLVDYSTPRRRITEWYEIQKGVLALIGSFIVDCFEAEMLEEGDRPRAFHHPCKP
jgi:hypothetical protein